MYVINIFLGFVQLNFSAVFGDTLLYGIYEDFCHLKYNFFMYRFSLELTAWLLIVLLNRKTISLVLKILKDFSHKEVLELLVGLDPPLLFDNSISHVHKETDRILLD